MSAILGVGRMVPTQHVSSKDLEARLGLEPGWTASRTGIESRPYATADQATSDLARAAGEQALEQSGVERGAVRLLVLATSTPDYLLPPTSPMVASRLGLDHAGAIDLTGACSGFLYGLVFVHGMLQLDPSPVLVIAANVLSRRLPLDDPRTTPLFSDGAGAVVMGSSRHNQILGWHLGADGRGEPSVWIPAGGSRQPLTPASLAEGQHLMRIDHGRILYRSAVRHMAEAGQRALTRAGLSVSDVDWWIPHQANRRITHEAGKLLGISPERTVDVIAHLGNSSAATIPMALAGAVETGQIQPGQTLLLTAVGAGIISAAVVLRWS